MDSRGIAYWHEMTRRLKIEVTSLVKSKNQAERGAIEKKTIDAGLSAKPPKKSAYLIMLTTLLNVSKYIWTNQILKQFG